MYLVQKEKIENTFDLITAFHSIEHVLNPENTFKKLLKILSPKGCILVQVPDIEQNPYDLLVADHRSHFTEASFARMLKRMNLAKFKIYKNLVPKELSIFIWKKFSGKKSIILSKNKTLSNNKKLVVNYIKFFERQIQEAKELRKKKYIIRCFRIFNRGSMVEFSNE